MKEKNYGWLILLLAAILLIPGLGNTTLWIYDEVRNAECAREMYERSDWIVPTFNGKLRAVKPPLHYYFMFGGYSLFGVSEWGARFFSAVFGILTVIITYFFTARFSNRRQALITSLILLSSTHYLFQFRLSVPDPYLIFFNVLALFSGYAFLREGKSGWIYLCAMALGLGTLAKGPIAIALPGMGMFLWIVWQREWKKLLDLRIVWAGILCLVIAVPWYLLVHKATDGAFTRGFFIDNNINRFSSTLEGHGGIFLLIPLFIFLGMLPASVFSLEAFRKGNQLYTDSFLRFALTAFGAYLIFYSFSGTKLPNYPFPSYPFLAILLGNYFNKTLDKGRMRWYPLLLLLVITIALTIGAYYGIQSESATRSEASLSVFAILLVIGAGLALYFAIKKKASLVLGSLFIFYMVFHLFFLHLLYPRLYHNNPLNQTIETVKQYDTVVGYKNFQPSYTFYLPNRIHEFDHADSLQQFIKDKRVIVITRTEHLKDLEKIPLKELARHHDIFELPTTVVLGKE